MHDIKAIRENPDQFDKAVQRRGLEPVAGQIIALDKDRREVQTNLQAKLSRRNEASREIGQKKAAGEDADALLAEVAKLKEDIPALETQEAELTKKINTHLISIPNILDDIVPDGEDEAENALLRSVGEKPVFSFTPLDHVDIGEGLGQMDFAAGARLSGARFVVLQGQLARLERALAAFMLDVHTKEHGYLETLPPALVRTQTMTGTGQLPKFAEDLFHTTDDRWLIPTAEVPLTNMVADTIVPRDALPMRLTAFTPCFRAEAGSAGRDTRGLIRQHQFSKVELVTITTPENSKSELERMTGCAETILQRLGLAYRVLRLCSGDTGFSAQQTLDIEVWLPGQDEGRGMYREISSCSNCGPFQARRMKARTRKNGEKETEFLHTLNGSALAVGRCMIAVLENGQQEDGSVLLPEVLHSYMGCDRLVASA
ncbi:MAG: Serine--tRNA ligase [Rhodospirillaceae bacterium]|jgi:seryl-tRNA synthetase|nr:MAG: Serine--tRNA ligase [Rhodospirillaceae bacterium]